MNWLDFGLVFVFILNVYNGFKQGLLRQVVGLASFFIALYVSFYFSGTVRGYLDRYLNLDEIIAALAENGPASLWLVDVLLNIIAFLLTFLVVALLLAFITRRLKFVNKIPLVGPLNAFLGSALGGLKGLIIVFLIIALLSLIQTEYWTGVMETSAVVALSSHYMSLVFGFIVELVTDRLGTLV